MFFLNPPVLYLWFCSNHLLWFCCALSLDQLCDQVLDRILIPSIVTRRTFFKRSFVWRCEYNEFVFFKLKKIGDLFILICALIAAEAMIFQDKCSVSIESTWKLGSLFVEFASVKFSMAHRIRTGAANGLLDWFLSSDCLENWKGEADSCHVFFWFALIWCEILFSFVDRRFCFSAIIRLVVRLTYIFASEWMNRDWNCVSHHDVLC